MYVSFAGVHGTVKGGLCCTYTNSNTDILRKHDSLELNDEEIHNLRQVLHHALECLAWNGVVSLRPHLGSDAFAQNSPASNLGRCSDAQEHVRSLQDPTDYWDVARGEDEQHDGNIADSGCTWVGPVEQVVEEGMVVGEVLAVVRCRGRRCTRGG